MGTVKIKGEKILSNSHSVLKEINFDIEQSDGKTANQTREVFFHGNAVAALLYNHDTKKVILTKQFRIATFVNGNSSGTVIEACAGLLEDGEEPEDAMIREIKEETGYAVKEIKKLYEAYSSPGAYSELIHYFLAPYTDAEKVAEGGGLAEEGEDVELLEIPVQEAWLLVEKGEIKDAKTILLLIHLKLHEAA